MEYRADYAVRLAKQKLAEADIGDEEASNDAWAYLA